MQYNSHCNIKGYRLEYFHAQNHVTNTTNPHSWNVNVFVSLLSCHIAFLRGGEILKDPYAPRATHKRVAIESICRGMVTIPLCIWHHSHVGCAECQPIIMAKRSGLTRLNKLFIMCVTIISVTNRWSMRWFRFIFRLLSVFVCFIVLFCSA